MVEITAEGNMLVRRSSQVGEDGCAMRETGGHLVVPPAGLPLPNIILVIWCHAEIFAQKISRTGEAVDRAVPHCP